MAASDIPTATRIESPWRSGRGRALGALALVCAAAAACLAVDARFLRPLEAQREFQHLVGGLGCGAAVNIAECEAGFDPRLSGFCTADCGPIPGGRWFCRHHACSMLPLLPPSEAPVAAPDAEAR